MLIDFYLYNPHEVVVWEPIIRQLLKSGVDARIVIEPPGVHTAMGSHPDSTAGYRDDKTGELVPLMTVDSFREANHAVAGLRLPHLQVGRYRTADAVVTTQGIGWLWRYEGSLKLKTAYGCAANRDVYGHSEMNVGLDGVFVQGEQSRAEIANWVDPEDVIIAGYPKFAAYFRGEVDRASWSQHFGLDSDRLTVAYFATWAHNSSLDRFAAAIAGLSERYNVLFKPHHNNLQFESERLANIQRPGVVVDCTTRSNVPFLAVADVVIADVRSGSMTEALMVGRPTIGLSAHGNPFEDALLDGVSQSVAIAAKPEAIASLVADVLVRDDYAMGRQLLCRRLFTSFDGADDRVTAEAMVKLIKRKQNVACLAAV